MALFTVDPNNVFGKTVDEAGTYNVKVADSSVYKESSTHKPMAVLNFEVLDGKYAGGQIRYDNVVWDDSTTEKYYQSITRFNTIMVMAAVPEGTPLNSIQEFVTGMIGKKLAIDVDWTQSQNGKFYLTVQRYRTLLKEGSQPNGKKRPNGDQATDDMVNGFNQSQQQGQPANNQQQGQPIDVSNDELPF